MEFKKIMVIVNSRSGMGRGLKCYKKLVKWKDRIVKEKEVEINVDFTEKFGEKNATNLAKRAVQESYNLIIIIGGDGTVNEVANGVVGSDITILVVRAGNGNDFARAQGIPKDVEKALNLISQGKIEPVDLGKVNDRVFVNAFGVGFDAKITQCAEALKKKFPFKNAPNKLLYLIALLRELLLKIEYLHLEVKMPRAKKPLGLMIGRATLLLVAIGPTCGGVFRLTPQANSRDGLFDICWIKKTSRWRILKFLPKAIKGTHLSLPEVRKDSNNELPRASFLTISSLNHQKLPCQMDGEILPAEEDYLISNISKGLNILVP